MKSSTKMVLLVVAALIVVMVLLFFADDLFSSAKELGWTKFETEIDKDLNDENNKVVEFKIDNYNITAYDKSGKAIYKSVLPDRESEGPTRDKLEEWKDLLAFKGYDNAYTYTDPNATSIWSTILPIIYIALIVGMLVFVYRASMGGGKGAMSFGKTKARLNDNIKVRFNDVAGAEEEKEELKEIVEFLKNPKKFSDLGARIPKGVLLVGPPGTGKTLFAKAVAGEASVPFFSMSGSDFVELYVGVGASRVRDLFDIAKKNMPCIIFIDEIDAVGRQRGAGLGGGHDEREQTLNQLLVQMDGFETNEGIIVMAATNRADILDHALLRPGRFDRQVYVSPPDVRGREAILKVHSRNKPLAPDVNFKVLARMTSGFSGADLENLLNEAAILAARASRRVITNKDLYEGLNKVIAGPEKKSALVTETDKRLTAYHEGGHAILAEVQEHCDKVHEVTIIPRGRAGGFTMTRPMNDNQYISKTKLFEQIVVSLGGRVAEELVLKEISTGAYSDIRKVSEIARNMVTNYGMSEKLGPISFGSDEEVFIGRSMVAEKTYSHETAKIIDEEVNKLVTGAYEQAKKLLTENRMYLDNMARLLVERETIFSEEVDMIMSGKSVKEIMDYMDKKHESGEPEKNPFDKIDQDMAKESDKRAEELKKNDNYTTKI